MQHDWPDWCAITGFIFYLVGTAFVVIGLVGSFFFDTTRGGGA